VHPAPLLVTEATASVLSCKPGSVAWVCSNKLGSVEAILAFQGRNGSLLFSSLSLKNRTNTLMLKCTALHCTALHCTALHCTALHCTGSQRSQPGFKIRIMDAAGPGGVGRAGREKEGGRGRGGGWGGANIAAIIPPFD
jgi:hypothetical protein